MTESSGGGSGNGDGAPSSENAYEKLSREVHQMQTTSAIHQEWLENPKGYLLKPDFKRRLQHVGAGGKKLNSSRVLRIHLPGNTYRKRWFVLDGMILRYFKSDSEDQELGEIHLASVNAVLPSSVADAPEHALDLVCADRIYTVAGNDREDMVRWATVLTLVLRGEYKPKLMQRPESTIIRGSSVIPRVSRKTSALLMPSSGSSRFTDANGMRLTAALPTDDAGRDDNDTKEKIITVTFDQCGSLGLQLRGTVDDEVMVCGFQRNGSDGPGLAEASGVIKVGDLLISINHHYFTNMEFAHAIDLIQNTGRPLTLRFSRIDPVPAASPTAALSSSTGENSSTQNSRIAEGWILAKEPAAHRYRIRMLQLHGNKLKLYKPSMQGGRASAPTWMIRMDDVTDIRPINDTREAVSAFTQCYPKQWGVTLEGTRSIFTFYTRNREEMLQWVDLLKNSPLFGLAQQTQAQAQMQNQTPPTAKRLTIPVHPVATVEFNAVLEPKVLLSDRIAKLGDLILTAFAVNQFVLLDDGKMMYYVDAQAAEQRARPIGTIRCDSIVSIVPSYAAAESGAISGGNVPATGVPSNFGGATILEPTNGETTPTTTTTTTSVLPAPQSQSPDQQMPWRLELGIMVNSPVQKYRRSFIMCFESQDKMMKWGASISRETKRLTGHEYDLSSIARRPSRSNSYSYSYSHGLSISVSGVGGGGSISHSGGGGGSGGRYSESQFGRPTIARVITNPLKFCDPRVQKNPPLYRSLKDVATKSATKGWFFLKKPRNTGYESYHPRFAVLHEQQLLFFKYEVDDGDPELAATLLSMREIKDVREAESGYQENLDFTIQLTTVDDVVWMMVAESFAQKETWLSLLIWISDYYYRGQAMGGGTSHLADPSSATVMLQQQQQQLRAKAAGLNMSVIRESDNEDDDDTRPRTSTHASNAALDMSDLDTSGLGMGLGMSLTPSANAVHQMLTSEYTEMSGYLTIGGRSAFASIASGVFSYYEKQEDHMNEWGDAIDAISLSEIEDVHSDGFQDGSFVVKVKGENEVQLVADSAKSAKRWMLVMCSCGELILKKASSRVDDGWASTMPKEAWIWKLDRLYQVFRRRHFSLRNHQLIFSTDRGGRPLGMVSLPCIYHLSMSKVIARGSSGGSSNRGSTSSSTGSATGNGSTDDFYQLEISFAIPGAMGGEGEAKAASSSPSSSRREDAGDFYALLLAFDSEHALREWANAIYDCCTNSMSVKGAHGASLGLLGEIQILPRELLKTCTFQDEPDRPRSSSSNSNSAKPLLSSQQQQQHEGFSASGWLYYRTSREERVRLRYFVQWGYELSIYKHEVLADEASAIRYGVIDCRALVDVRFAYINSPENAVELVLGAGDVSVVIIPRTDDEAVMWRNALLDVKRAYGYLESGKSKTEIFGSGLFISRGSTFSTQKDNEELLRLQIEASVLYSTNLQEHDGSKWIPKYFVLTSSRVVTLSLAVHLYDEEPDILGSFATKEILEVRSCSEQEDRETGNRSPCTACVLTVRCSAGSGASGLKQHHQERIILKCDSLDHCLEWMRLLCATNGKLELKKNAATGLWGSVNRVASLSRHHSFMATTGPLSSAMSSFSSSSSAASASTGDLLAGGDRASRRLSRVDAAKRRTSELIMNRKMSTATR